MTTGLVLITAILILGGVIATMGDRIGMRVGKARLSLFNLRPRQTATMITILTGGVISTSTLAILFLIDGQLRTGVFELEEIQAELESAQQDLNQTRDQKEEIQTELETAVNEQIEAEERLQEINTSLEEAIARQRQTQGQLEQTRNDLDQVATDFQNAQAQLQQVSEQSVQLQAEIQQIQTEREQLIAQRDRDIAQRDRAIEARDQAIAERETRLLALEEQRLSLQAEIADLDAQITALELEFNRLREGSLAFSRGEPLLSRIVRLDNPSLAQEAVDTMLSEANRVARRTILPDAIDNQEQVIRITLENVEAIQQQLQGGQDYVVRIYSGGNYVVGEPCVLAGEDCVRIYAIAAVQQIIFPAGEIIAAVTINPAALAPGELGEQYENLGTTVEIEARRAGVLTGTTLEIADNRLENVITFLQNVREYNRPLTLQAVASSDVLTSGPIRIELRAVRNGVVLFSTNNPDVSSDDSQP
jgi:uncharacterized protein (DUF3084 family)